jgi:transaldolase
MKLSRQRRHRRDPDWRPVGVIDGVMTNPSLYARIKGQTTTRFPDLRPALRPVGRGRRDDVDASPRAGTSQSWRTTSSGRDVGERSGDRLQGEASRQLHALPGEPSLLAKAGASLLSPFVGRVDDTNEEGMIVIRELSEIVNFYDLDAEVLAASIRGPRHITDSALAGAHIATLPFKVLQQMVHHPLTDVGIVKFKQDWESARAAMAVKA